MALKLKAGFVILLACLFSSSAEQSILDALSSSEFFGFAKLIEHARLSEELNKQHEFITIFSPSDNFLLNKVSPVLLSWLNMEKNLPTLRQVLMNHIIIGKLPLDKINTRATSISGVSVDINDVNGILSVEGIPIDLSNAVSSINFGVYSIDGLIMSEDAKGQLSSFLNTVSADQKEEKYYSRHELSKLEMASLTPSPDSAGSPFPSQDLPSPSPSDAPSPGPSSGASLAEVVLALNESGNYQNLIKYLALIDPSILASALSGDATILAPSDYAFGTLDPADLQYLINSGRLDDVILYHIISSYVTAAGFGDGAGSTPSNSKAEANGTTYEYATLLEGKTIIVTVIDGKSYFGSNKATISQDNILANGQTSISGLDQVLIPSEFLLRASPPPSSGYSLKFGLLKTMILLFMILFFVL